ncbi:MAG: hypothetical protein ACYTHM_00250 [Planctomycetota bacterium]|jgi:hypothetical protein
MEGALTVTKGEGGKIESATFSTYGKDGAVQYSIALDSTGKRMAEEMDGRTIQVAGSVSQKKGEKILKVKSYCLFLVGSLEVTKDDKGKVKGVKVKPDGSGSPVDVILDGQGKALGAKPEEGKYLVTGILVALKEDAKALKIKTAEGLETVTGTVQVKEDRKGRRKGASLVVGEGEEKIEYTIAMNGEGYKVMLEMADARVEVLAVVMGRGKKKTLKIVRSKKV